MAEVEGVVETRLVAAGIAAPPGLPGVYAFRDAAGGLLYVGTSGDLGRRVRSYFAPRLAPEAKPARIARLAVRVEWRTRPSVLEALVLEARTIATERPYFNRRLKDPGRHAWVRFDPRDPFPRLEVTRRLEDGPWRWIGPFPGGRGVACAVERVADAFGLRTCRGRLRPDPDERACLRLALGQCGGPCVARTSAGAYGRSLARAIVVLGEVDEATARASGAAATAAGSPPVRLGGALAGALAALRAARRATQVVVVVPAAGRPGHRLLAVAGGRLVGAASATDAATLGRAFAAVWSALARPLPALLPGEALDEVRIVTGWLASVEGRAATIDAGRLGRAASWTRVLALVAPGPLFSSRARRASA